MARRSDPSGQSWTAVVRNHAPQIAAMDLLMVLTIAFDLLYAFIIGSPGGLIPPPSAAAYEPIKVRIVAILARGSLISSVLISSIQK
jgi:hypothetical protein